MSSGSSSDKMSEARALCPHLFKNVRKLHEEFGSIESLGKGGFGRIFKAKRRFDDKEFAIKIIKFECNVEDAGKYKREAKMLSSLDHNNIVRYYNSWIETARIPRSEYEAFKSDSENSLSSEINKLSENGYIKNEEDTQDGSNSDDYIIFESISEEYVQLKYLCIQMELCAKRTLKTAIDDNLYQNEDKITRYFKEICEGLLHIHKIHIVHRDLKPENIFLTSGDVIKIGDFGLSKQITLPFELENYPHDEPQGSMTDVCGTRMYIAPELYIKKLFNKKADIYSLGLIYFEMCSKPMTEMEKSKIFPLLFQRLKTIDFLKNTSRKRFLLRSMTHSNYNKRPSCDDILKILNTEESINEVKEIMHRNKTTVPHQQINTFRKALRLNSDHRINCTDFFLKEAVKIFERHGAQNISVPTFLPSFNDHYDNLTTLLNVNGNSVSISNTSKIGFAHYVSQNKSWNLRRYSVGKIFEGGYFLPSERQECVFEAVSSEPNDSVNDAEILWIAKNICDCVFRNDQKEIRFYINHRYIFSTILKHCRITHKNATLFTNTMIDFSKRVTEEDISPLLSGLNLHYNIVDFLLKICRPLDMTKAQQELKEKFDSRYKLLTTAVKELHLLVLNANRFGIKTDSIFLSPLLNIDKISSGFMFKIELEGKAVIGSGGRFDSLIKQCMKQQNDIPQLSAVGISFTIENVVMLLRPYLEDIHITKVLIYAKEKTTAIPLYKKLLEERISCQVMTTLPVHHFRVLITLRNESLCTLYVGSDALYMRDWMNMNVLYNGKWNKPEFFELLWKAICGTFL